MNLAEYFKACGVDDIADDEVFVEAEHEAMVDYFDAKGFFLEGGDLDTLIARGLMDDFELSKMNWEEWHSDELECELDGNGKEAV